MDACFEILLSTRQTLDYLEVHQETFTWGGVEYPQGEKYYVWGKYIKLVEREIPAHIIKRLPPVYGNRQWVNFSVQGKGLDLLESEVNGAEIDWEGKSFDDFLKLILTEQPQWVVVFEWHCDRLDSLYEQNVSECISQIKNNLKWENNREGFLVLSVPENEIYSSMSVGGVAQTQPGLKPLANSESRLKPTEKLR
ncbi:hypothetical protein [Microcoleus sp.]|uniref:hypothetical protein n=1 Tax=Microcoleus sp. TaxID=44472 RepID=UPI003524F601